jgi:hypothetical protein
MTAELRLPPPALADWYFRDFYLTYQQRPPSIRDKAFRRGFLQNSKQLGEAKILHEAGAEFAKGFSCRLSWSRYRALLKVHDSAARAFYLLVDLKLGKLAHQDVGQMDSYVRLFDDQGRTPGDGPTIGLLLCAEKNEAIARYSILKKHKQFFAAKYMTYLPTEEELRRELERDRRLAEAIIDAPHTKKAVKAKPAPKRRKS